jgi:hypothetical protein
MGFDLDSGEPTYLVDVDGKPIPVNSRGRAASSIFSNVATDKGINPQVLLATAEKENSLISRPTIPIIDSRGIDVTNKVLNFAMGCGASSNFSDQIKCAAKYLIIRFNETTVFGRAVSYPFFFRATDGIRHAVSERCNVQPFLSGCKQAAFAVENAATYAQYRYTPFIQSLLNGGGVFLFEKVWQSFGF